MEAIPPIPPVAPTAPLTENEALARVTLWETISHAFVSVALLTSATVLAAMDKIDSSAWAGACATAIGISGAVTIVQGKRTQTTMQLNN